MAGSFTTLAASGAVTLPLGAQVGYLWQCTNAGTGACGWAALPSINPSGALSVSSADTNLSVTLGGTPTTALLAAASIGVNWAGLLSVTRGGTGLGSCATGDIPYGSGSNTIAMLAANATATRKFLLSVSGAVPEWTTLTTADIASATMNFTSIGFAMTPPSNAYISTTSRTGVAGANYQITLGGTYTGISGTTDITDLDITTTHTSGTGGFSNRICISVTPNTNATTATITNSIGLRINGSSNTGGTVTNSYTIYNSPITYATTNIGYYQGTTFTKLADRGMILGDTFSPTAAVSGVLGELILTPTYNPTTGPYTVNNFYNQYINPTITKTSASIITTTAYYGFKITPAAVSMSGSAHVITDLYNIYSSIPSPTLANGATVTRAYSGYFVNPSAGTSNVALYTDSLQVGGTTVSSAVPAGTIKIGVTTGGIVCASAALATSATAGFLAISSCPGTPTATPSPLTTGTIPVVYDSTNNNLMVYNSLASVPRWMGVGECLIFDQTGDAATTNYTTSTLPAVFNHLHIVVMVRTTYAAGSEYLVIRPNSDSTTTNYSYAQTYIIANVGTNSAYTTDTSANLDPFVGYVSNAYSNSTTANLSTHDARILHYNNANIYKNIAGNSTTTGPTVTTTKYSLSNFITTWKSTAAITTLYFKTSQTSAFSALSRIMVYGYM